MIFCPNWHFWQLSQKLGDFFTQSFWSHLQDRTLFGNPSSRRRRGVLRGDLG